MTPTYLAFDLGAESGRGVAGRFEKDRIRLEEICRFANRPVWMNGRFCWDFPFLLAEIQEGIKKFIERYDQPPAGVSCDSWGVDFGLIDKRGNLLGLPVHYRDRRTEGMGERVFDRVSRQEIYSITGIQFMPLNTLFQIESLVGEDDPQWSGAASFLSMADLVHYFLCGARVVESSLASTTHLYDAAKREWAFDLIDRLGYPKEKFPDIVPSATRIGTFDKDLGNALGLDSRFRNFPIIASLSHDTAAAVAAVPGDSDSNWAYLSSGTWSLLGVELRDPILTSEAMDENFTNEAGAEGTVRFLKNIMGLWILQECRRVWSNEKVGLDYSDIVEAAREAESKTAFIDPDDPRFFPPGDMPSRVRDFCRETGQPVPEGIGPLARCVMESLALKYRFVLETAERLSGLGKISDLHIVGGGGKNEFLNQMVADATGVRVKVGPVEATAMGNIVTQAVAMNEVEGPESGREWVRKSTEIREFSPAEDRKWEGAYSFFVDLIGR